MINKISESYNISQYFSSLSAVDIACSFELSMKKCFGAGFFFCIFSVIVTHNRTNITHNSENLLLLCTSISFSKNGCRRSARCAYRLKVQKAVSKESDDLRGSFLCSWNRAVSLQI